MKCEYPADGAVFDQPAGILNGWIAEIVVADESFDTGLLGGFGDCFGLVQGSAHRLFKVDILAGGNGCQRHLGMQGVRRRYRHQVNGRILNRGAPVIAGAGKAVTARRQLSSIKRCVSNDFEPRVKCRVQRTSDRVIRQGVTFAHEARTEQRNPNV